MSKFLAYMTSDGARHYLNIAAVGREHFKIPLTLVQRANLAAELAEGIAKEIRSRTIPIEECRHDAPAHP